MKMTLECEKCGNKKTFSIDEYMNGYFETYGNEFQEDFDVYCSTDCSLMIECLKCK